MALRLSRMALWVSRMAEVRGHGDAGERDRDALGGRVEVGKDVAEELGLPALRREPVALRLDDVEMAEVQAHRREALVVRRRRAVAGARRFLRGGDVLLRRASPLGKPVLPARDALGRDLVVVGLDPVRDEPGPPGLLHALEDR